MGEIVMTKADYATEANNSLALENKTINELFAMMFEVEHPVGSLYLSTSETDDPNSKWSVFGITCTWELVPDVFLLGAGGSYALGTTGGEVEHTLTVDELAEHSHHSMDDAAGLFAGWGDKSADGWVNASIQGTGGNWSTATTGGSQPHNNMPPYLTTNIWKRIS